MPADASRRVFFALWPDAAARSALDVLAREAAELSGGRATAASCLHLTLAFLGAQPAAGVERLCALAGGVRANAFALLLDTLGSFTRTGIVWLGARTLQPQLATLQGELCAALQLQGFALDQRPYAPHLTLARRGTRLIERSLPQAIGWRVQSFALVGSELGRQGPVYRNIATWALHDA